MVKSRQPSPVSSDDAMAKSLKEKKERDQKILKQMEGIFKEIDKLYDKIAQVTFDSAKAAKNQNAIGAAKYSVEFHDAVVAYNALLERVFKQAAKDLQTNRRLIDEVNQRVIKFANIESNFKKMEDAVEKQFEPIWGSNPIADAMFKAGVARMKEMQSWVNEYKAAQEKVLKKFKP